MKDEIKKIIEQASGVKDSDFSVEVPSDKNHGDYSTNVALVLAKKLGKNPSEVAKDIKNKINSNLFKKVEVAGPGFINFFIADKVFIDNLKNINKNYGKSEELKNKKIIIDYTDPNPFKEFHIGHLMNNAIGESLSRIFEFQGAKVKRVCYQGDVGMHVAKAIWGKTSKDKTWGEAYALGVKAYEEREDAREEIKKLNVKIYERSDWKVNKLYNEGKKESLRHFAEIYKKLDTKFDYFIFESETGPVGKKIVLDGIKKGIFEWGDDDAIIFKGEKFGLHTRVFVNSAGLPTYEAKDLGLAKIKYKKYEYDQSVVTTGNEVNEYFKVMICAMEQVLPELAKKTKHIGHGMLRLPEGKMSSRTGKVITAESLIEKVEEMVKEKNEDAKIAEIVGIGAIKYSILKQSVGSDIIYDFEKSISFEGDSGPYLQYAYTRANSVLEKSKKVKIKPSFEKAPTEITQLEKSLSYFPEIVAKTEKECEPHFLVLYLTELAGIFNNYYAKNKIVDTLDEYSPYKVALTRAFTNVMKNGLWMLGIKTPEKM